MDGYVVIGTKLDTKQLETDLKTAKKDLTNFQKEEERLLKEKGKVDSKLAGYEEEKAQIRAGTDELLKKAETEDQVNNLLNMENGQLENLSAKYGTQITQNDQINTKLEQNKINQELIKKKIADTNRELAKSKGYAKINQEVKDINKSLTNVVKKVGKWALAVFSVRGAYALVRQASSTLARYNEQYAKDLEYLRFILAQTLAPVLQFLVNLAYKLLSYIGYIAKAWFGVNIFSKASAKNFNSMARQCKTDEKRISRI